MKVTLENGKQLTAEGVHGRSILYQGIQRYSLVFLFAPGKVTLDEVLESFTAENCAVIAIMDDEGNSFIHENYTIRLEAGLGYKDMALTGGVSSRDTEQMVYVRMAQSTMAERQIQNQQDAIDALLVAALEEG